MPYLLQVDFPYPGPWAETMTAAMRELAQSIADEPGLLWKLWTENETTGEAGGVYCSATCRARKPTSPSTASACRASASPGSMPRSSRSMRRYRGSTGRRSEWRRRLPRAMPGRTGP